MEASTSVALFYCIANPEFLPPAVSTGGSEYENRKCYNTIAVL